MDPAMLTKMSFERITLFTFSDMCNFAIISTCSTSTETANYMGTKLVGVPFKMRNRMKNSLLCVHILHKTLNLVISCCCFTENGKELYQNLKQMCRMIVFVYKAFCFETSLLLTLSLLKFPNDMKSDVFDLLVHCLLHQDSGPQNIKG